MAEYDHWRIAGWDDDGVWRDTEHGDSAPDSERLPYVDDFVIAVRDNDGVDHYYHIDGPFDDYDDIEEYIDVEIGSAYGGDWA